jgi:hypothetical protein
VISATSYLSRIPLAPPTHRMHKQAAELPNYWPKWESIFWDITCFQLFNPQDGGDKFLRNVGGLPADMLLYPELQNSS